MCYGFLDPSVEYSSNLYLVKALLNDPQSSVKWYPKPHLSVVVNVRGQRKNVTCTFCHRKCTHLFVIAEPFPNLTCPNYAFIPHQHDFKMQVVREDPVLLKKGNCSTIGGIRLGYLSIVEISKNTRNIVKKIQIDEVAMLER